MNLPGKQQGLSTSGWIFLILIIGGLTTLGMKLAPHYMDFNTITTLLDNMSREQGLVDKRASEIKAMITKRLKLNNIRDFGLDEKLTIKRASDRLIIELNYDAKVPIAGNLQLLATFAHKVELRD